MMIYTFQPKELLDTLEDRKIQTANDGKFYEVLADSKKIMAKK